MNTDHIQCDVAKQCRQFGKHIHKELARAYPLKNPKNNTPGWAEQEIIRSKEDEWEQLQEMSKNTTTETTKNRKTRHAH